MKTKAIKLNISIIHPIHSFLNFFAHINNKKLKSEIINLEETKNLLSKLEDRNFIFGFDNSTLLGKKEDVLNFLNTKFGKDGNEFIAKNEIYDTKKGEKITFGCMKIIIL